MKEYQHLSLSWTSQMLKDSSVLYYDKLKLDIFSNSIMLTEIIMGNAVATESKQEWQWSDMQYNFKSSNVTRKLIYKGITFFLLKMQTSWINNKKIMK